MGRDEVVVVGRHEIVIVLVGSDEKGEHGVDEDEVVVPLVGFLTEKEQDRKK